jgi:ribonuclease D
MRDEVLLQLARHPPATVEALRGLRGLHGAEVDRTGEQLIATIRASLALPPSAWPQVLRDRKPEPESIGLVELLQAVLKARAAEAEIAPTLLATSADLQALVEAKEKQRTPDLPVLRGWRRELVGDLLLQILNGAVTVSVDPVKGVLRMSAESNITISQ